MLPKDAVPRAAIVRVAFPAAERGAVFGLFGVVAGRRMTVWLPVGGLGGKG
jgi:hypothetical protein